MLHDEEQAFLGRLIYPIQLSELCSSASLDLPGDRVHKLLLMFSSEFYYHERTLPSAAIMSRLSALPQIFSGTPNGLAENTE